MGCFFSKPKTVPSVPTPERTQPSQPTSIPDGTTSILPPKPGTAMISCARGRAQSQSAALSQSRHDDGRDYCSKLPTSVILRRCIHLATSRSSGNASAPISVPQIGSDAADWIIVDRYNGFAEGTTAFVWSKDLVGTSDRTLP